jgi:hypothetical protein
MLQYCIQVVFDQNDQLKTKKNSKFATLTAATANRTAKPGNRIDERWVLHMGYSNGD